MLKNTWYGHLPQDLPRYQAVSLVVNTRGNMQLQMCCNEVGHCKYALDDVLKKLVKRGMPIIASKNDATYIWAVCMIAATAEYEEAELLRQGRDRTWSQNFAGRRLNDDEKLKTLRKFLSIPIPMNSKTAAGAKTQYSDELRQRRDRAIDEVYASEEWNVVWEAVSFALGIV